MTFSLFVIFSGVTSFSNLFSVSVSPFILFSSDASEFDVCLILLGGKKKIYSL